jgi:hypothetical protein
MHQQVRTSPTRTGSGSPGPGAQAAEGGVVDILQILVDARVNLQSAGGCDLDQGGEFVFAVHHDDDDDRPNNEAARLLREHGYPARAVKVHHCYVNDEPGGLLGCIKKIEAADGPITGIFVGTPDEEDGIPVQLTTRRSLEGEEAAS